METLEDRTTPSIADGNPLLRTDLVNGYTYEVPTPTKPMVSMIVRGESPSGETTPLAPPLSTNFDGFDYVSQATTSGFFNIPPDTQGAAGPNHLVTAVNTAIRFSSKTNSSITSKKLGNNGTISGAFFDLPGTSNDPTTTLFDPRVLYDQYADRFVVIAAEQTDIAFGDPSNTSFVFLGVSMTSDPNGAWNFQRINTQVTIGTSTWADYPALGIDSQAIYITANQFTFGSSPAFAGQRLWILPKGIGTGGVYDSGGTSAVNIFNPPGATGQSATTAIPAHAFGTLPGSVGTWLVRYSGTSFGGIESLSIIRVDNPLGTPTFTHQLVSVGDIDSTGLSLPNAPQSGTSTQINTGDRRALAVVWRDNNLYTVAHVRPPSGVDVNQCTAHWWRLTNLASSPFTLSLADQGNIGGEDISTGAHTFYPNLAVDSAGNIGFGFSASSSTIFPGAYYTARASTDSPGTVQSSGTLQAGVAFYVRTFGGSSNRWGDYSGAALDPANGSFWVIQQYAMSQGNASGGEAGRWSTRWGNFTVGDTTPPTITSVGPVSPNPRNTSVSSITVVFSEPINLATFTVADLTLTRNGSPVTFSGNETFTLVSGSTYQVGNLTEETGPEGNYVFTVIPTGIQDLAGNPGTGSSVSTSWTMDTTAPTITTVGPVTPNPRNTAVSSISVVFSEPINLATFTVADLTLTRNGSPVTFSGNETFTLVSGSTYQVGNLSEETGSDGNYVFTVIPAGIQDPAGNAGSGSSLSAAWTMDTTRPTVVSVGPVVPNPRNSAISSISVTFSEVIDLSTFTTADLDLTYNGSFSVSFSGNETIAQVGSSSTYTISGLAEETAAEGSYDFTVIANAIKDLAGNDGLGFLTTSWIVDLTPPTISSVGPVSPNPRNTPVSTITVVFSEPINLSTFTVADLTLTRNGSPVTFSGNETFTLVSGSTYQVGNLTEETGLDGSYVFTVIPGGIQDVAGNSGSGSSGSASWTMDATGPTVLSVETISPNPRSTPVPTIDVVFSETINLATFTAADVALTRNGSPVTLSGDETFTLVSGTTYRVSGLAAETTPAGNYVFTVFGAGITDALGNAGTGSGSTSWTTTAGDTTPPGIAALFLDGSAWTASFRTAAGSSANGYPAQTGAGQLVTLPWSNLNRFTVQFTEALASPLTPADVEVKGTNAGTITGVTVSTIDALTYRIQLPANANTDFYLFRVFSANVQDAAGNKLAGTFVENSSAFPTGGTANVDFTYRFRVAVGDADRNGLVRNPDVNLVRANLFNDLPSGTYSIFFDINGDGVIRNVDVNTVRANLFNDPPGTGPSRPIRGGSNGNGRSAERESARITSRRYVTIQSPVNSTSKGGDRRLAPAAPADLIDELFDQW